MADANGRQTNSLDYAYYNAGPGTVASGSSAVGSKMETSHDVLNPAFASTKTYQAFQQGADAGFQDPEARTPAGGDEVHPPDTGENLRDTEGAPMTDHSAQLPNAPTIGTATATGTGHASVTFTAPVDADGYAITGYTLTAATSDGGTIPAPVTGTASPLVMAGLTATKHYTFTVTATNLAGTGPASAASNSIAIT